MHIKLRIRTTLAVAAATGLVLSASTGWGQTAQGELEGRPAPVALRKCVGGANAGNLCNTNAGCPGSSCVDRNIFNISVAIHFMATPAELTTIQNMITVGSATLFDVTDGQAQIGSATLHNNAFGTDADVRIYPASNPTWWQANTGNWQNGGSIHVSIDNIQNAGAPGESFAHEFIHLAFDARDEYEMRAAGCGMVTGGFSCPDAATITAGQISCLMDSGGIGAEGTFTELCWGQGNPGNLNDLSGGNHDATNATEQSVCRSNRSCWDQVVWSYPNTMVKPGAAPDPAANGATVNASSFVTTSNVARVVMVLDESGSMSLESPSRMSRLKVAANDFVTLAETGTQLGIVSFSNDAQASSGRVNVNIAALGANRSAWTSAINGMAPNNMTNIGAGLQRARDMITAAGGVTANTFIVLMTDGLNNRPSPQATADADLAAQIAALMAEGIEVYVTCTGSDLGLQSQCSEIASGTGGWYVDSATGADLARNFVLLKELVAGRQPITSQGGQLKDFGGRTVFVEKFSESVTFTLVWDSPQSHAGMYAVDPGGNVHRGLPMPQGLYIRAMNPIPGDWQLRVDPSGISSPFHFRAFSRNQFQSLGAGLRHATVRPGEPIEVYAFPRSVGGAISRPNQPLFARVIKPDGSMDSLQLVDSGRDASGGGDDVDDDGTFTGVYQDTKLPGAYRFLIDLDAQDWPQSGDYPSKLKDPSLRSPRLQRQVELAGAVADPGQVETTPEDHVTTCPKGCEKTTRCEPGKFIWAPACGQTCPNGTAAIRGLCLIPVDASGRASCINSDPNNCPPFTPKGVDCTAYNREPRQPSGDLCRDETGRPVCETSSCVQRTDLRFLPGIPPLLIRPLVVR
jgi:hypothetical protein